ncbi:MAG: phage holin family protein [Clostridia bacterium]|nr:phage holin family protein [Clostridia bacterium]
MEKYLYEGTLILIPVLNVIGWILKNTQYIPDKYIPLILLPLGVLGSLGIMGFNVTAVLQGVLVTGTAVYSNQLVKQMKN